MDRRLVVHDLMRLLHSRGLIEKEARPNLVDLNGILNLQRALLTGAFQYGKPTSPTINLLIEIGEEDPMMRETILRFIDLRIREGGKVPIFQHAKISGGVMNNGEN